MADTNKGLVDQLRKQKVGIIVGVIISVIGGVILTIWTGVIDLISTDKLELSYQYETRTYYQGSNQQEAVITTHIRNTGDKTLEDLIATIRWKGGPFKKAYADGIPEDLLTIEPNNEFNQTVKASSINKGQTLKIEIGVSLGVGALSNLEFEIQTKEVTAIEKDFLTSRFGSSFWIGIGINSLVALIFLVIYLLTIRVAAKDAEKYKNLAETYRNSVMLIVNRLPEGQVNVGPVDADSSNRGDDNPNKKPSEAE